MKNKKEVKTFKALYEQKAQIKRINESSWFGIIIGALLFASGTYQSLCTVGILCVLFNIIALLGIVLILMGGFFPLALEKIVKANKTVFAFIGDLLLKSLLLPVYGAMIIINFFTHEKYLEKFGFCQYEEKCKRESSFVDYDEHNYKKHRYATIDSITNVLLFFSNNKMYIMIPIVIVLLVLGIMVFFASSNAVFSFVYTIF